MLIGQGLQDAIYSPDNLYQLVMTGVSTNPGDLRLRYCPSGFDLPPGSDCNTASETPSVEWKSLTGEVNTGAGGEGIVAALQDDGNLVVYDSLGSSLWSSNTCALCTGVGGATTPPYYVLYLPGATSSCPCKAYMCIVVDLSGGGVDYYYAVTDGAPFTKTLASCPP